MSQGGPYRVSGHRGDDDRPLYTPPGDAARALRRAVQPPPKLALDGPDPHAEPGFQDGEVRAGEIAILELADVLGARRLQDISQNEPPPLLLERLDPESDTVLFGPGGIGKGALTASWLVRLAQVGGRALIVDYENHPSEWARRVAALGGQDALDAMMWVCPAAPEWTASRGPLWSQAADLRALADAFQAGYAVVDSVVPACGGMDPLKPETAALYFSGLRTLGRPTLSLAHSPKAESSPAYPFGSVFWHNLPRTTWSLEPTGPGHQAMLVHRKANNYARQGRVLVTFKWQDGRLGEVSEQSYAAELGRLIEDALIDGPMTAAAIVDRLNETTGEEQPAVKPDSVRHALRRGVQRQRLTVSGSGANAQWAIR
jgi:hypothetical protein